MKKVALYALIFLLSLPVMAQKEGKSNYDKEKLESAKVAFITKRLDLSPDQAEKFWPLYNQHSKQRRSLMKEIDHLVKDAGDLNDEKAMSLIERKFEIQQEILDLEISFMRKIVKTISPVQATKLDDVNKDFARHIYRLQKRDKGN